MVEKRKPLILSSTKNLLNSLLNLETQTQISLLSTVQLRAGILQVSKDAKIVNLDDSALVGITSNQLRRLCITSGSLVLIKNVNTNQQRIGQVVVLDPPGSDKVLSDHTSSPSHSSLTTFILPLHSYPDCTKPEGEVAYLSPILAFNLNVHLSCLRSMIHQGKEALSPIFEAKSDNIASGKDNALITLGLEPLDQLPKYATHLRASFVKIPECGTLDLVKKDSSIEAEDRQELIDMELNKYFGVDRFLSRGDIFSVCINWNCKSALCIPCSQKKQNGGPDLIYFKVVAMEPSEECVLRVNRTRTALVLGGNVPSAVPPDFLIPRPRGSLPLQVSTVKTLASILIPPLCPSALSSKFRVVVLLHGLTGCGKRTVVKFVARQLGLHVVEYNCQSIFANSDRTTSAALAETFSMARRYSPTILLLRHFEVFKNLASNEGSPHDQVGMNLEVASVIKEFTEPIAEDEEIYSEGKSNAHDVAQPVNRHPVLLVAAADSPEGLPPTIRRCFSHEIKMDPLNEAQRKEMLSQSFQHVSELLPNTSLEDLVKDLVGQTSGFMPRDLRALVADAGANLVLSRDSQEVEHLREGSHENKSIENNGTHEWAKSLSKEDVMESLERSKKRNATALGTPKVPNVKWEDVGGLEDVKKSILDTVQLPLLHKDLFSSGLRKRSGVLFYGPPGTGKTLLAKAVATECSLNFLSVKGPELINMYIGESEKNVRDIFQKARSARPCVIFFDELDSLAPARGASGDSGGVMDRVVSQMLAEIDGLNDSTQDLFIIGASNRPDLIDPALLRPGRFDKLLYVGVNSEASYRERVLKALTRKFKLKEDISLLAIAKRCPPNFTGADMYALCADAWFHAAKRKALASGSDSTGSDDLDGSIVVEYEDFLKVLGEISPSLSMAELKKYELLREQFEGSSR
ncbi:peroxisomal ATPase PEX6 isoform X1 [Lycium barbarum]|uniref:peroxisomal ATPase PEX6 isoform X1 n=1 Tax=Lycium barbarum TaxID=112863 RepID=UPI00293E254D|nr:peroxisomal ATPase PEX6 isoform X1 [Lycium barbarum]